MSSASARARVTSPLNARPPAVTVRTLVHSFIALLSDVSQSGQPQQRLSFVGIQCFHASLGACTALSLIYSIFACSIGMHVDGVPERNPTRKFVIKAAFAPENEKDLDTLKSDEVEERQMRYKLNASANRVSLSLVPALSLARSAQAERDNELCFFLKIIPASHDFLNRLTPNRQSAGGAASARRSAPSARAPQTTTSLGCSSTDNNQQNCFNCVQDRAWQRALVAIFGSGETQADDDDNVE
ncbi:hypothetical protein EVAR_3452_1 [Eumeta japonica]|uniref:Uncharacterized protein n=1 Tax=Eumeta variegata TaxID=151549 RepID=A0A4C1ST57_EUMVA|nr:hypothetical protein EVAR_3452_1 [Eumeta japonica]